MKRISKAGDCPIYGPEGVESGLSPKHNRVLLLLLLLIALPLLFAGGARAEEKPKGPLVRHDRATDRLTVEAKGAPLTDLLGRVGALTGVEILIDSTLGGEVTARFADLPVEQGLKQLFKAAGGLSNAMVYSKGAKADDPPVLISVTILPADGKKKGDLVPAVPLEKEVAVRAEKRPSPAQTKERISPLDDARWQARLEKLSAEQRAKIVEHQKKMEEDRKKAAERREERRKEHDERREKKRAEMKERRLQQLEPLKNSDPEEYERRVKELEERGKRRPRTNAP